MLDLIYTSIVHSMPLVVAMWDSGWYFLYPSPSQVVMDMVGPVPPRKF